MNDKPEDSGQPPADATSLRQRAEAQVRSIVSPALSAQSPEEIQQMLHELRVHQIELEMQNEELRTAQALIEAGRVRYFEYYDLAPVGYCTVSEKGLILEANLTAATLLGTARSALLKQPLSSFILKEDQDICYLHRKQLLATGEAQDCELRLLRPDGTHFWAHLAGIAAQADDGAPVCRITLSDITARKRAEEVLRDTERNYRALAEASSEIAYGMSADWSTMLPLDGRKLVASSDRALTDWAWLDQNLPRDEHARVRQTIGDAIARKGHFELEHRVVRPDGSTGWTRSRAVPILDENGDLVRWFGAARDITKSKQMAQALQNTQALLANAEKMGRVGGWEIDVQTLKTTWTEGIYDIYELDGSDRLTVDEGINYGTPASQPMIEQALQRAIDQGEPFDLELEIISAKGKLRNVHAVGKLDGARGKVSGFFQDITARKGAELALKASSAQLQLLETCVSRLNDIVLITEAEPVGEPGPRIVFVNDAFVRRTGFTREEVIGKTPRILQGPKTDRKELDRIRAALGRWEQVRAELLNYTKSGVEFWLELDIVPVADATGWFTHWIAVERDVTERRAAVEKLRSSAIALKNVSQGVVVTDHNQRTLSANIAFSRITGYDEQETLGRNCNFLHGPLTDTEAKLRIRQALKDGLEFNGEILNYHKNGTPFWNDLTISPVRNEEGVVIQYVGIMRDVTERERAEEQRTALEEQLRESQKMEAIGTLAGGIAHDFNNILAAIQANTLLALEDSVTNPDALESLGEIAIATTRACDLVQQILSFSRRQATSLTKMSLMPVIEESARLLRATLPPRLSLRLALAAGVPNVNADATQIQQVVINACTNAMYAMHARPGRIDVILDSVLLDQAYTTAHPQAQMMFSAHPGQVVRLVVRDNGPGMDAATLARVFEPFFTTKPVGEGTGLGLAVVHGIAQKHQGAIFLESEVGCGTTFTLLLPAAAAVDAGGAPLPTVAIAAPPPSAPNFTHHILLLDDDEPYLSACARLLERSGLRVSAFSDQGSALAAIRAAPLAFDLLVTDYNMPGMSGLDVCRAALAIDPDLPVVLTSGFIDDDTIAAATAAGVVEFIFKASDINAFRETVKQLAEKFQRRRDQSKGGAPSNAQKSSIGVA